MYKSNIVSVLNAVDSSCVKQLILSKTDKDAGNVLNEFFEMALGFQPFYAFMPTRLAHFVDRIHSDSALRDFVYNTAESMVFKLRCLKTSEGIDEYAELVKIIASIPSVARDHNNHLSPEAFLSTVDIASRYRDSTGSSTSSSVKLQAFLYANPIIVMFYVLSQHVNELQTFNEIYIKDRK